MDILEWILGPMTSKEQGWAINSSSPQLAEKRPKTASFPLLKSSSHSSSFFQFHSCYRTSILNGVNFAYFSLFCCLFPSVLECSGIGKRAKSIFTCNKSFMLNPTVVLYAANKSVVKWCSTHVLCRIRHTLIKYVTKLNSLSWGKLSIEQGWEVVCWKMFNNPLSGQQKPWCAVSADFCTVNVPPWPISSYQGDVTDHR